MRLPDAVPFLLGCQPRPLREANRLGDCREWETPTPTVVANEIPGTSVSHILQNLPDHDARAFEGGFAVTNRGVRHDVLAQFDALLAVFHMRNLSLRAFTFKHGVASAVRASGTEAAAVPTIGQGSVNLWDWSPALD